MAAERSEAATVVLLNGHGVRPRVGGELLTLLTLEENAVNSLVAQLGHKVTGVLKTFDRMLFRGTLLNLIRVESMVLYLNVLQIARERWGEHLMAMSDMAEYRCLDRARELNIEVRHLGRSGIRKEELARQIAAERDITEGPIVMLTAQEPCKSFRISPSTVRKGGFYVRAIRPSVKHVYLYQFDPEYGFMHVRLQTWFPFNVQVYMNGHDWLARAMDKEGLDYEQRDNCFTWVEDIGRAQTIAEGFLKTRWERGLDPFAQLINPALPDILGPFRSSYYWSLLQSEFSTDVLFRRASDVAEVYRPMILHGINALGCQDVLRFFDKKQLASRHVRIDASYKATSEGVRLKHRYGHNSIKVYNKAANVIRFEVTINNTKVFKTYRAKTGDPKGPKNWRALPQGVAHIRDRAKLSEACNERYAEAFAVAGSSTPLGELVQRVSESVSWRKRRARGLRLGSPNDLRLLRAVTRGEFALAGFRNSDLQALLFDTPAKTAQERRRRSAYVTRLIRLLRAHHLLRKVPKTHRYKLTTDGRENITAILAVQEVTLQQLRRSA